jgi:hypothetical protein
MNLFEIQAKLDNIFNQVIENEGELDESLASELEIAQEELDDKLYAYSFVIDRYSSDIALLKQYKKALDDRIARFEKNQDKLKDAIAEAVYKYGDPVIKKNKDTGLKEETGAYSYKTPVITINVRKTKTVETDNDLYNHFALSVVQHISDNSISNMPNLPQISAFATINITSGLTIPQAAKLREMAANEGILIDDSDIKVKVSNKELKDVLDTEPEGLDAWTLGEKDVVTIRK